MESGSSEGDGLWPLNLWRGRGEGKRRTYGIAERAGAQIVALNGRRMLRP
jgi:hypothetical protein